MNPTLKSLILGVSALAVVPALITSTQAADNTWNGISNSDLSLGTNWSSGLAPVTTDVLVFDGTDTTTSGANALTVSASINPGSGATGIAGIFVTSTQTNALDFATGSNYVRLKDGGTFTVASGAGAVTITTGRILLGSGAATYTFTNNSSNDVTWASTASGDIGGGTGAKTLNFGGTGNFSFNQNLGIGVNAPANFNTISGYTGVVTLAGSNGYGGSSQANAPTFTIAGGTLRATNAAAFGASTTSLILPTLNLTGGKLQTTVSALTASGTINLSGTGSIDLNTTGIGTVTLANNENFVMSGGTWNVSIASSSSFDQIISTGTGATGGTFSITGGTLALSGITDYTATYNLLSSFTGTLMNSVSGLTITGYDSTNWIATLSNTGVLSFASAIPEPSSYAALVSLVALGACALKRRRIRQ